MNNNLLNLYTPKQIQALKCYKKDFWILTQHGAKRTGKTVSNNDLFLLELKRAKEIANKLKIDKPQYILAGNSLGSLSRNVLVELTNKYGLQFHFNKFNEFELFGVKVCCFGHGTVRDMARIRGMTAFGAYINEGTTGVEEVIREILNRCSGEGARILMDTNPDNPEHYIKKDYIDKADGEKFIEIHYELDDNTFLSERYKENIKSSTPSGQFYDRDIKGLWVNSEGTVYKDFDKNTMVVSDYPKTQIVRYIAGVDWGYEHLGSICVVAIDVKGNCYLVEEHVHQHQEIDFWVNVAKEVKAKYGNIPFYCDTARTEHIARFMRESILARYGNKEILSGIEVVASLMKQGKFFVLNTCKHFMKEVYNYVWDSKKGLPMKTNDDLLDSIRYAIYTDYVAHQTNQAFKNARSVNYLDKRINY